MKIFMEVLFFFVEITRVEETYGKQLKQSGIKPFVKGLASVS